MANDQILNSQITATSTHSAAHAPWNARLGLHKAWSTHQLDQNQWIQVALNNLHRVGGVITQGFADAWMTRYKVEIFSEDDLWRFMNEANGQPKVLNQFNF